LIKSLGKKEEEIWIFPAKTKKIKDKKNKLEPEQMIRILKNNPSP
jgi:hypothetical protein